MLVAFLETFDRLHLDGYVYPRVATLRGAHRLMRSANGYSAIPLRRGELRVIPIMEEGT
jgi:hypothetical protein